MLARLLGSTSVCLAALLTACACEGDPPEGGETPVEPSVGPAPIPTGTIEGIVRLAATSDLPRYATNPMEAPGATPLPEECTPPQTTDREPLRMGEGRGLRHVPVVGLGDASRWPATSAPSTVTVHIRDCRLDPPVVTATTGDVLRIENDLVYPFFPSLGGGTGFSQAVLPGEPRELELDSPRPMPLECTVTARCGHTEVLVFANPVHTTSGDDGHFRLSVPADQDVELVAWHPLINEASIHTRVAAGETTRVEIEVTAVVLPEPEPGLAIPPGDFPEDHPELGPF